jgi:hypothetical protein
MGLQFFGKTLFKRGNKCLIDQLLQTKNHVTSSFSPRFTSHHDKTVRCWEGCRANCPQLQFTFLKTYIPRLCLSSSCHYSTRWLTLVTLMHTGVTPTNMTAILQHSIDQIPLGMAQPPSATAVDQWNVYNPSWRQKSMQRGEYAVEC